MNAPAARRFWRPRFRLATLFWITLVAALALAWRTDRQRQDDARKSELRASRLHYEVRMAALGRELTVDQEFRGRRQLRVASWVAGGGLPVSGNGINTVATTRSQLAALSPEGFEQSVKLNYAWVLSHEGGVAAATETAHQAGIIVELGSEKLDDQPSSTPPKNRATIRLLENAPVLKGGGSDNVPPTGTPLRRSPLTARHRGLVDSTALSIEQLLQLLENPLGEYKLEAACLLAVQRLHREKVLPVLVNFLQTGENDRQRSRAALAMAAFGGEAKSVLPELEAQLAAEMGNRIETALQAAIYLVKGEITVEAPDLKLSEADLVTATRFVSCIERLLPEAGLPFAPQIAALLDSPDEYLCMAAARALSRTSAPGEASKKLLGIFENTSEPIRRGLLACLYLGQQQLDEEADGK